MQPTGNPLSAGTYLLDRRYSVGDEIVFETSDPIYDGQHSTEKLLITRVDEAADRVEVNGGVNVLDGMGNPVSIRGRNFDPRVQRVPAEIQVGKQWINVYHVVEGSRRWEADLKIRVVSRERVTTPCGDFDAFRLEGNGWNYKYGVRLVERYWIVPGFNFEIKRVSLRYPRNSNTTGTQQVVISCRQRRWAVV